MRAVSIRFALFLSLSCFVASLGHAADAPKRLKGLWTTGGCCHDYKKHAPFLTEKIGQYANVGFTIVDEPKTPGIFKDPDFAKDYDVVVYDVCYASEVDEKLIGNVVRSIEEGKPTVVIHCAMHTFRDYKKDDFREAIGLTTKVHDGFRGFATKKAKESPITAFWPSDWTTPGDELYQNIKFWPTATPLLTAYSTQSKKDHVVAWTNEIGHGKVFGTTLGHNMLTVGQDSYHHLLANGLLWACGKLDEHGKPLPGYEGSKGLE
jgi:type 1 glutamine amidotransferase